jgi:hypothetical protein
MYEHRWERPIPRRAFLLRMARHGGIAAVVLSVSLVVGIVGYHAFERLSVVDGFLNSAMLLGGMGPVDPPKSVGGKIFAGFYALYAGLVFITLASLLGAPIFHRLLHRFHWEEQEKGDQADQDDSGDDDDKKSNQPAVK